MRFMITQAAIAAALALGAMACETDEELQQIGAEEVADFEQEKAEGDHPIAEEFTQEAEEDDATGTEAALQEEAE